MMKERSIFDTATWLDMQSKKEKPTERVQELRNRLVSNVTENADDKGKLPPKNSRVPAVKVTENANPPETDLNLETEISAVKARIEGLFQEAAKDIRFQMEAPKGYVLVQEPTEEGDYSLEEVTNE